MVEKEVEVFQVDNELVKDAYQKLDNYLIENNELKKHLNICTVYFSSNYIYFSNNSAAFKKSIVEKNNYEWYNLRNPNATKHIFIRDIFKQWYLHGINSRINSIELLVDFLKKETNGYETTFIGSSAGGFAAVLLGSILNVKKIYGFNNQFYLTDLLENSNESMNPLIFREQDNIKISKYFNKSKWDINQFNKVKDLKMNVISVNTSIHGIPLLKNNLTSLFLLKEADLLKLTKTKLNPILFSFKIVGVVKTIGFLFQLLPNAFRRWLYNPLIKKIRKNR
jgi:hypothetical protein